MARGRREIGHGALACGRSSGAAGEDESPYVLRVVSDILESNGSSSMRRCAERRWRDAAGIPIKSAVAGVAMAW